MTEALEITTLRPAPGLTAADFDDGTVVDIVAYDSRTHAERGASGIMGEMGDSPVHSTIDHTTVGWQLTTVLRHVQ